MSKDAAHHRARDLAASRDMDVDTLARTLWGEARGEGERGMQAVANVVMNRVRRGGWWGRTVSAVCLKPYQFSCWLADDPNRQKLLSVGQSDKQFAIALDLAAKAVAGELPDITAGAIRLQEAAMMIRRKPQ